jgi:DNA polymerase
MLKHKNDITKCEACHLALHRDNVVIGRGSIPADVLFLGEAPGIGEDSTGIPFTGPSGTLLDAMLEDACTIARTKKVTYYITNTVLCRPWIWDVNDPDYGEPRVPSQLEVLTCMNNVMQIANRVKPKIVLFVGRVAERFYKKEFPNSIYIVHPAAILRQGGRSSPFYMTNVRKLSEVFKCF